MNQWNTIYQKEREKFTSELDYWSSLVAFLQAKKCRTILDLGCGSGLYSLQLAKKSIVHFMFNKQLLRRMFHGFTLQNLWVEYGQKRWEKYYCLLAQKSTSS